MGKGKILVVDDNGGIRAALKILLSRHFDEAELIASPKQIHERLRQFRPDAVLLDMNFEADINTGNEGLFWLSEIKKISPQTEVVLFTAYADISIAVEGMKRGAFDFVVKPYDNEKLINILKSACAKSLKAQKNEVPDNLSSPSCGSSSEMYWGEGKAMKAIRNTVKKIAPTDASVLITGENGTGKDMLAQEIWRLSGRALKPMVCVDVGAIADTLFESELFGHVKGAFTDAYTDRTGKIERADGGTLFLDEIGNIPLNLQAKLLRVLQNRVITKVGDTRSIPVDIRLICATNRDIEDLVRKGEFREDLYYRINTIPVALPPLRERKDEIVPLANIFVGKYAEKYRRNVTQIDDSGVQMLLRNRWSGNIRELQNCIEKAVILSEKPLLSAADFDISYSADERPDETGTPPSPEGESLEMAEERTIRAAMERYNGNLTLVAKSLEISRPTLYSKLKKYNI